MPMNITSSGYEIALTEELLFNWDEINTILCLSDKFVIFEESFDWFEAKLAIVWGIIHAAGEAFLKSTSEKRAKLLSSLPKIIDPSVDNCPAALLEATLIVTAAFERFVGNIYQSYCSRPVPFLLRDLLATEEISEVFGNVPVSFSQFLVGCVSGLNVRNIAWHGFFSENELHINLVSCLIILFASLIDIAHSKQLNNQRPPVDLTVKSEPFLNFFPDLSNHEQEMLEFINTSTFINPVQRVYWKRILDSFRKERHGECLVMILPQLEQSLRTYFCPSNLLCAQPSEFYVTLDQIISTCSTTVTDSTSTVSVLGQNLLEMLQDAFVFMDGPRIRDKISHGEVILQDISHSLCNHVLSMAFGAVAALSKEMGVVDKCLIETYLSRVHPTSCLRRSIDAGFTCLLDWPVFESADITESSDVSLLKSKVYDLFNFPHSLSMQDVLKQVRDLLNNDYFHSLHRQTLDPGVVSQAIRLVSPVRLIVKRLSEAYYSGRDAIGWRQRQRKTYERMICILPNLQSTLFTILATITFVLKRPVTFSSEQHKRLLKSGLKYIENVLSLSQKEKNRWLEIAELTRVLSSQYSHYIIKYIELAPNK